MELMSLLRLLLCALAALPEALGVSMARLSEIKLNNNTLMINQKQPTHKIHLNINGPPLVKVVTELQSVFRDIDCRDCATCMERAIKAYKIHSHIMSYQPQELYYNVLNNNGRRKRNTAEANNGENKIEQGKNVMATVTKYTRDKKVFAIKVKEMIDNDLASCEVYSVKKSVPCGLENDIISGKKSTKYNKKNKRIKEKTPVTTTTTESVKLRTSVFKKREVDNSHVSESFMPSIEDLY